MSRFVDLTGKRFGRLIVTGRARDFVKSDGYRESAWTCRCDCGNITRVRAYTLLNGKTTSCRCFQKEIARSKFTTHGMTKTRVYRIWSNIKTRTSNPTVPTFHCYGGRGIKMCKRWERSFENFLEDMGMPPSVKHSVERKDGNKGYYLDNCRWATQKEQNRNRCDNRILTINGVSKCLAQWAEDSGVKYMTLFHRVRRGWPLEKALVPRRFSRWERDSLHA